MAFSRKSYKLTSDAERSRVTGIVHEKLLSDYLHRVFASPDHRPAAATSRILKLKKKNKKTHNTKMSNKKENY